MGIRWFTQSRFSLASNERLLSIVRERTALLLGKRQRGGKNQDGPENETTGKWYGISIKTSAEVLDQRQGVSSFKLTPSIEIG